MTAALAVARLAELSPRVRSACGVELVVMPGLVEELDGTGLGIEDVVEAVLSRCEEGLVPGSALLVSLRVADGSDECSMLVIEEILV